MIAKVTLVGNPNTGKTTLYNTMTGANEKASNWHGVTVGVKSKKYNHGEDEITVTDLPGIYSIKGYSKEEKIAGEYLENHKDDLIINICDANNLKRNFMLTSELIEKGYRVLIVVNMSNECKNYDYEKITNELGADIIEIDARKTKSVKVLKDKVSEILKIKTQKSLKYNKKHINIDDFKLKNAKNNYLLSEKLDKIILNKAIFIPFMAVVLFLIFYITYGTIGSFISDKINIFFNLISCFLQKIIYCINMPLIIKKMICDGLINSFITVFSFLPQIVLLMFFMNLLEDIGLMSRFAFMLDGMMKRIGLTGKSLFSLMMGYGCTTSAVITTRNLDNEKARKTTVCLLPFVSCSAKLPIFLTVASLFFDRYKYLFVFGLYIFSIIIQLAVAIVINKISKNNDKIFLLEMPKYRVPNLKKILKDTFSVIWEFIVKVGIMVMFCGLFVWFLRNFNTSLKFLNGNNFNESLLYFIANKIAILFKPIGLDNVGIVVSLILGLMAKEMIVVGLSVINGTGGLLSSLTSSLVSESSVCYFTKTSSLVFLVFVLLYSPCVSAMATIKNEYGAKLSLKIFIVQTCLAYIISFIVNLCLNHLNVFIIFIALILLLLFVRIMLKLKKKNKCSGDCYACGKF